MMKKLFFFESCTRVIGFASQPKCTSQRGVTFVLLFIPPDCLQLKLISVPTQSRKSRCSCSEQATLLPSVWPAL